MAKPKKDFMSALSAMTMNKMPAPAATKPEAEVVVREEPAPQPEASAAAANEPHAASKYAKPTMSLEERLERAGEAAERGGLLGEMATAPTVPSAPIIPLTQFTREAAVAAGRPLRRHRVADLIVHPQNPRPISGDSDLDDIRVDWRKYGQKDPIHIVPINGVWGIMEGQRRWLVARLEQTEELDCFEHPPMSPIEVYSFGMSVHRTRRQQTAIDESKALEALLNLGAWSRGELIIELAKEGIELSEVDLSKMLAINGVNLDVLKHVLAKPVKFSHKHLYALSRLANVNVEKAVEQAHLVRHADEDKPVSASSIERVLKQVEESGNSRRTRRSSTPKKIRGADGADLGLCRGYADGKIEFKPTAPLNSQMGEQLHQVVSAAIADFFAGQKAL